MYIFRTFRIYDDDGSKGLNLEEFMEGVKDYGLDFSADDTKALFQTFDKDGSGTLSFDEFLISLRVSILLPSISPVRLCQKTA